MDINHVTSESDEIIRSQIDFYRASALEFASEYMKIGPVGEMLIAQMKSANSILELAAGAGRWTEKLCRIANKVVAVDSSPELLELNRKRLLGESVKYIQADIFSYPDLGTFDTVFFAFWLSHVPEEKFESFWSYVRRSTASGGCVVFIDSVWSGPGGGGNLRKTSDGREFNIVKTKHSPSRLTERLRALGFSPNITSIDSNLYVGHIIDGI